MLHVLYNSSAYRDLPIRERRKAAQAARQRAMGHWQLWGSLAVMVLATLACSWIARNWIGDRPNGTIGAVGGFLLGMWWYSRVLFRIGMPYYREILSRYAEHQS
jgi:hypothetical protein